MVVTNAVAARPEIHRDKALIEIQPILSFKTSLPMPTGIAGADSRNTSARYSSA
jgi:hypothetical protein